MPPKTQAHFVMFADSIEAVALDGTYVLTKTKDVVIFAGGIQIRIVSANEAAAVRLVEALQALITENVEKAA